MTRWLRPFHNRSHADILAVVVLLSLSAFYAWLTWGRLRWPFMDQGWYMQVTARVAAGEVLYRDTLWIYGPLPVYVLGALYRLLRTDVALTWILYQILATLACLLAYRAARFLLSAPLALLGTVAVFLGGLRGGGFVSYVQTYTGAVPLGTVLGLLFVVCLLSYLKSGKAIWLVGAGVATGCACLTKLEFALACVGTGVLFLSWIALFPAGFANRCGQGLRALGIYLVSTAVPVGIGYGLLAHQAGWRHVWTGILAYEQAASLFWRKPPWGTRRSWIYIVSGLGLHLLVTAILVGILTRSRRRGQAVLMGTLIVCCLSLIVLPWGYAFLSKAAWLSTLSTLPVSGQIDAGIQIFWAPGMLVTTVLIAVLGFRWLRATRCQQPIDLVEWCYAVLVVYSALVTARFYFNPTIPLFPQYVNTLFPVLIFSVIALVPRAVERWGQINPRRFQAQVFLVAILVLYAGLGFTADVAELSQQNVALTTPRGTLLVSSNSWDQIQAETLQYIISHTGPEDAIVVVADTPGFYFLSGRKNPLRQDWILSGIGSSPADAEEIVRRLEAHQPGLIIVDKWTEETQTLPWGGDLGREHYRNLTPVWQYVHDHYRVQAVVGGERGRFNVYEPRDRSP